MKTGKKIVLLVSMIIFLSGVALSTVSACMINFDFSKLDVNEYITKTAEVTEQFGNIEINTVSKNVIFRQTSDKTCRIEYTESSGDKFRIEVKNDTLFIDSDFESNLLHGLNFFDFSFIHGDDIIVYLPDNYKTLKVSTVSGDIRTESKEIEFDKVSLHTTSGDIKCEALFSDLSAETVSGDINIRNSDDDKHAPVSIKTVSGDITLAHGGISELDINTTSGDVRLDRAAFENGKISTVSGDVKGSVNGEYKITTHTVSGDISVPSFADSANKLEISTTSGDVTMHNSMHNS